MRHRVRSIPEATRATLSRQIAAHLGPVLAARSPLLVMGFAALPDEPDILDALWEGAQSVALPCVTRPGQLVLRRACGPGDLAASPILRRLREPNPTRCPEVSPAEIDLVLVPGVAFARDDGTRLGRGGGFYDRLLGAPGFRAFCVGVCFDVQVIDHLPTEPHDQRVGALLTESGYRETGRR
jgi:5-formyltetrahydrofolate cyclo-ligase